MNFVDSGEGPGTLGDTFGHLLGEGQIQDLALKPATMETFEDEEDKVWIGYCSLYILWEVW